MRKVKAIFITAVLCSGLSACMFFDFLLDPPGKGAAAEAWFKRCQPIIDALENYKIKNLHYPENVKTLLPEYVGTIPEEELKQGELRYRAQKGSYELMFTYYGPGVNYCIYKPESKWSCSGYY